MCPRSARAQIGGPSQRFVVTEGEEPGISLLMIGTPAVGLAVNGIIFNVLDAMVLRPFEFPNTSRLVRLWETGPGTDNIDRENVSPANSRIHAEVGDELVLRRMRVGVAQGMRAACLVVALAGCGQESSPVRQ